MIDGYLPDVRCCIKWNNCVKCIRSYQENKTTDRGIKPWETRSFSNPLETYSNWPLLLESLSRTNRRVDNKETLTGDYRIVQSTQIEQFKPSWDQRTSYFDHYCRPRVVNKSLWETLMRYPRSPYKQNTPTVRLSAMLITWRHYYRGTTRNSALSLHQKIQINPPTGISKWRWRYLVIKPFLFFRFKKPLKKARDRLLGQISNFPNKTWLEWLKCRRHHNLWWITLATKCPNPTPWTSHGKRSTWIRFHHKNPSFGTDLAEPTPKKYFFPPTTNSLQGNLGFHSQNLHRIKFESKHHNGCPHPVLWTSANTQRCLSDFAQFGDWLPITKFSMVFRAK